MVEEYWRKLYILSYKICTRVTRVEIPLWNEFILGGPGSKSIQCFSQIINWLLHVSRVSFALLCWLELLLPYDTASQATSFKYYPACKMKGRKRGSSQNTFVRKKRSVSLVYLLVMLLVWFAPHGFMTPFMVLLRAIYLLIYWSDNYKKCWSNHIIRSPA